MSSENLEDRNENPPGRSHFAVLALLSLVLIFMGSWTPFDFQLPADGSGRSFVSEVFGKPVQASSKVDFVTNVLLAIPLAFFLCAAIGFLSRSRRSRWTVALIAIAACVLTSVIVEGGQVFLEDRRSSRTDLLAQLMGGVIGAIAWNSIGLAMTGWIRKRTQGVRPVTPLDWYLRLYLVGYLFVAFYPFDMTLSPHLLYEKLKHGRYEVIPFESFGVGSQTAQTLILEFAAAMPIGALLAITWTNRERPVRSLEKTGLCVILFAGTLEFAQMFVYSRMSATGDLIILCLGGLAGWILVQLALRVGLSIDASHTTVDSVKQWATSVVLGLLTLVVVFWRPGELSAQDIRDLREMVSADAESYFVDRDALPSPAFTHDRIGVGEVGCGENPTIRRSLHITEPGVYENILIDGQWKDRTLVRINANGVILRNCEVRHGTHNAIEVNGSDVLIENCRIHHVLKGAYGQELDAHGITGSPSRLVVRNCEIYQVSGDCIQFDPARRSWDQVVIEGCTMWTGPLQTDLGFFLAGEVPGENAIDTKQSQENLRSRMVVKDCLFYGWKNLAIPVGAAVNIKEQVDVTFDHCLFAMNHVGMRLRGPTRRHAGALVSVRNCRIYDTEVGLRLEDRIINLKLSHIGFGDDVETRIRIDKNQIGYGYEERDSYTAPAITGATATVESIDSHRDLAAGTVP